MIRAEVLARGSEYMGRRIKTFDERRQELSGSIDIISNILHEFEVSGKVHLLRSVAVQLRALVFLKSDSRSLGHPLLFELGKEKGFPLMVYTTNQAYADKVRSIAPESLTFFSTGDPFSLTNDELYNNPLALEEAMETLSVDMLGQRLSVKDVLSLVADTEATHYDPAKPLELDALEQYQLGGLPTHYRVVYALGRTVRDLGIRFLQATT